MIGEDLGLGLLGEPERAQPADGLLALSSPTSGSGLTMPTPCSRARRRDLPASATIACETSSLRLREHDRLARVGERTETRVEGDPAEERRLDLGGQRLAPA